jgi:hypothetical protein
MMSPYQQRAVGLIILLWKQQIQPKLVLNYYAEEILGLLLS